MTVRRIIVDVDPWRPRSPVLPAVAGVAERLDAELIGLFVENEDLIRFAALPFAREVGLVSAAGRPMTPSAMERCLRALAREAQRTLELAIARRSVRWSFRTVRGFLPEEVPFAAEEGNLLVTSLPAQRLTGTESARLVQAGSSAALRAALREAGGVLVLAGGEEEIARTLQALLAEGF